MAKLKVSGVDPREFIMTIGNRVVSWRVQKDHLIACQSKAVWRRKETYRRGGQEDFRVCEKCGLKFAERLKTIAVDCTDYKALARAEVRQKKWFADYAAKHGGKP